MEPSTALGLLYEYSAYSSMMRVDFDRIFDKFTPAQIGHEQEHRKAVIYMCYWFASLYLVIEGWEQLGIHDFKVDALLASPSVAILRRYRDGVFRFNTQFFLERNQETLMSDIKAILWARSLTDAFIYFFSQGCDNRVGE
jgi:hypothetical protein